MKIKTAQDIDTKRIVYDGCMVTFSEEIIDLYNPNPDSIYIEDIAHHLSMICRWNGATKSYFSVAEHCCMMHDIADEEHKATALFHDSEEAYWGDIIKPVKNLLPKEMREKMKELRNIIFNKFGVKPIDEYIDELDFKLLQSDFQDYILSGKYSGMTPHYAKKEWLLRYKELQNKGWIK